MLLLYVGNNNSDSATSLPNNCGGWVLGGTLKLILLSHK